MSQCLSHAPTQESLTLFYHFYFLLPLPSLCFQIVSSEGVMCNKNSPTPSVETQKKEPSMRKTRKRTNKLSPSLTSSSSTTTASLKPLRRRNRTKTRKPKYLSLRLIKKNNKDEKQPQPNLFPLHPQNTVDDKDMQEENNSVALLFSSDGGATLNGLLEDDSTATTSTAMSEEGSFSPAAGVGSDGGWLVRKAMRRREEEGSEEERWVCYSEVVEKKETMEEVTSYCGTTSFGLLSLKLDHEGILNAWSDKGSLYIAGEAPQTVPDFHNHALFYNALLPNNIGGDGCGSNDGIGNTWVVPEIGGENRTTTEELGLKVGQREASVQRYKEKRQNRLFSKRIRYEVRKLNAEKRPRMKVIYSI
ncbi:hypothetical protein Ahy_A06g029877 [Arachis hypogaea]|uniref:CCT domain-containing protein n=1 Tax=Arachis hypogaea TaxID=3818 RepID=A0A445CUH4_ARAHY|nr:hypothetical protein Ahy_A06g029877 [Arachis hypogaea]